MTITLALVFGLMIFLLILNKANFLFINFGAILLIAIISFGVGYGIAVFIVDVVWPVIKVIAIVLAVLLGFGVLIGIAGNKGD